MKTDRFGVEFSDNMKTLIKCPRNLTGTYTIPDGVISISSHAFSSASNIKSIIVPSSVKHIEEFSLSCCADSIVLSNGITEIGYGAFSDCPNLKSITIPDSVTCIKKYAFYNCPNLKAITISDSVTYIEEDAFGCDSTGEYKVTSIDLVTIGSGLQRTNKYRIFGPRPIKTLKIGSNYLVADIESPYRDTPLQRMFGREVDEIVLYNGISKIGQYAFMGFWGSSINIPKSVTQIGPHAFERCVNLISINIPNSITEIGDSVFLGCSRLESVAIPNSVISIGNGAFCGCTKLKSIALPNSIKNIDNLAFASTSLQVVILTNGVRRIGDGAFKSSKLKKISLPNSIDIIGNDAFADCRNLEKIIVPHGQKERFLQFKALAEYRFIIKEEESDEDNADVSKVSSYEQTTFTDGKSLLLHFASLAEKEGKINTAVSLYEDAEKLGSVEATYRLGRLFIGNDFYKGYYYINKAAQSGHSKAIAELKILQSNR